MQIEEINSLVHSNTAIKSKRALFQDLAQLRFSISNVFGSFLLLSIVTAITLTLVFFKFHYSSNGVVMGKDEIAPDELLGDKKTGDYYYASPTGSVNGDGSKKHPWDLQTALNQTSVIKPGDILWLRDGVYGSGGDTLFYTKLLGTADKPIIIRQYPGDRATIDGGIEAGANSAYNWFWGFEITNSANIDRVIVLEKERSPGINMLTVGHRAINLIIHNTGHPGIGFWRPVGDGAEIYGSIFWGTGYFQQTSSSLVARGSAIYAQNEFGKRYIQDNISFKNFTTGMKAYTESSYANGFNFIGNTLFDTGQWLLEGFARINPMKDLVVKDNMTYRASLDPNQGSQFGYFETDMINTTVENNYFVSGLSETSPLYLKRWKNSDVKNNVIIGSRWLSRYVPPVTVETVSWNNNTYYGGIYSGDKAFNKNGTSLTFSAWKTATGFDSNSTFTKNYPTGQKIFIRPNKYEEKRANIIVYNWNMNPTAKVNLKNVLKSGDSFEIRDAQNFFGKPLVKETYTGGSIEIPLFLTDMAPILGNPQNINTKHTSAEFNAFVLLPTTPNRAKRQVSFPRFNKQGALFNSSVTVTINSDTKGAEIRYTTDGTEPFMSSKRYDKAIKISQDTVLKAKAFKDGFDESITSTAVFKKYDLNTGLKGHWKFDEGAGTIAKDTKGDIGDGELRNGVVWVDGKYGKAVKLDGDRGHVWVGNVSYPNKFTVSFWAKANEPSNADNSVVIGNATSATNSRNFMVTVSYNRNNIHANSYSQQTSTVIATTSSFCRNIEEWNHYAYSYDGSKVKLYCNGRLVDSKSFTGSTGLGANLAFGRWGNFGDNNNYFRGYIDEVRIYDRALSQYDIVKLSGEKVVPNENILVN